jgi:hypothetical protein
MLNTPQYMVFFINHIERSFRSLYQLCTGFVHYYKVILLRISYSSALQSPAVAPLLFPWQGVSFQLNTDFNVTAAAFCPITTSSSYETPVRIDV